MAVGAGGQGQGIYLNQFIAVVAVQLLFQQPQQEGGNEGHAQIADHFDGGRGEVHQVYAHDVSVGGKELDEADDEHHGGVLDVDDEVVADLGHNVAEGLGQDDTGHGLHVGHTDGLGPLGLAGVHGDDAAADGLGHVGAGVDGDHDERGDPNAGIAFKGDRPVGEIGQAVEDEHGLQNHRCAAEDLHIDAHDDPNQLQDEPLAQGVGFCVGDGVEDTTYQADDTACKGSYHRDNKGGANTGEIIRPVFGPESGHIVAQINKFFHGSRRPFFLRSKKPTVSGPVSRAGCCKNPMVRGAAIRWWAEWRWPDP